MNAQKFKFPSAAVLLINRAAFERNKQTNPIQRDFILFLAFKKKTEIIGCALSSILAGGNLYAN